MSFFKWITLTFALVCCLLFLLAREAYNEVFFLCGNINVGEDESSVLRQLNTVTLSKVSGSSSGQEKHLVLFSQFAPSLVRCDITLGQSGRVTAVHRTNVFETRASSSAQTGR